MITEQDNDMNRIEEDWARAVKYADDNRESLLAKYGTQSFAISPEGEVVDYDPDRFKLIRRISKKFPDRYFLITSAEKRIVDIPSPERTI